MQDRISTVCKDCSGYSRNLTVIVVWLKSLSVYLVYSPPFSRNRKPRPEAFQAGLPPLPAFDNLYTGRDPGAALAFPCTLFPLKMRDG